MPHICFYWLLLPTRFQAFAFIFYVCMTASSCSSSILQRPIKRNVLWALGSISAPVPAPAQPPLCLFFFLAIDAHHHAALICDAGPRSMLQFFMGRAQAKIMFSYSRVRNLKGAKVNNVRWCEPGGRGAAMRSRGRGHGPGDGGVSALAAAGR